MAIAPGKTMARRKRSEHYVNNKEFLAALVTYREDVEKWVVSVYVGMLGYYGSYCGQISPTFRAYQIMLTSNVFSVKEEDVQTKTRDIINTEEFKQGAQLVKNLGCSAARKIIESDARENGINESLE